MALFEDVVGTLRYKARTGDRDVVVDGRLLPERELTKRLGVSRRKLRQALALLEEEGMLSRQQGKGTFLRASGVGAADRSALAQRTSPAEIMEVRRELEPIMARLAALRARPIAIAAMAQLASQAAQARSGKEYEKWDTALHAEIARSAGNSLFLELFEVVSALRAEQGWADLRQLTYSLDARDQLSAQHSGIIQAIEQRNPEQAEARMRGHLNNVGSIFGI